MADEFNLFTGDGQTLPFSLEAEQSVLGAILLEPSSIMQIADILKTDNFYLPTHKEIYAVMWNMYNLNRKIDSVTVLEELKKSGTYDDAGGKTYLLQLAQIVPSIANIESYAQIILEKSYIRSLITASREIIDEASNPDADASMLLDYAEQKIYEIRQNRQSKGLTHIREVLTNETLDRLDKLSNPETRNDFVGIPSGISELDRMITGLNKSDLIILGARPGMGKTSFALNIARNVALVQKKTVCFFSLEMTREQLAQRLLSGEAFIKSEKLRSGMLDDKEWIRLLRASDLLANCNIYLDETSGIMVPEMKARLRRMRHVDLVIIDYLGLMRGAGRTENRVQEISEITRTLKSMAKELNVPIVCCAQLSRGTEAKGKSHHPQLSDLRDSGSIEQDADIVLFLYREAYYQADAENPEMINTNEAECIVAKNRHGETGVVKMHWEGEFTRFTTQEHIHEA
ncbi:MAG: replicative DNA helicase [Clostridiales bacterium 43-6]|nr:MAG: replicative DNA helicase [Clostridiales bacterium 43-6]